MMVGTSLFMIFASKSSGLLPSMIQARLCQRVWKSYAFNWFQIRLSLRVHSTKSSDIRACGVDVYRSNATANRRAGASVFRSVKFSVALVTNLCVWKWLSSSAAKRLRAMLNLVMSAPLQRSKVYRPCCLKAESLQILAHPQQMTIIWGKAGSVAFAKYGMFIHIRLSQ